ncbi:tRNA dimethylallyltransferase [Candidatus Saccharibacteria bacterium]|nr:tRNA dimethylallyltransferase [Candidatus Saccharibacteria bacterium]
MTNSNTKQYYNGPVVVIVGPTGSGKTGVSIEIAKILKTIEPYKNIPGPAAEIISADSRAIYKYMDIGTAKPLPEEQDGIPHFGIDLVEPGERFTVADWKAYAEQKIEEIRSRGHVPMVVGGTGLYIDALVFDYHFIGKAGEKVKNVANVQTEQKICSDRQEMVSGYSIFGIKWEPEELRARLSERANKLFTQELYKETEFLVKKYGWGSQAMKSNIYQFAWEYLQGNLSLSEAKKQFILDDWHLAKRQITWFKRNNKIVWLPLEKVNEFVLKCIQDG